MPVARLFRLIEEHRHQVWSVNAVGELKSSLPQQPYEWHTVRKNESSRVMDAANFLAPNRFHDAVNAGQSDVAPVPLPDPPVDLGYRDRDIDSADLYSENIQPCDTAVDRHDVCLTPGVIWS